MPIAGAVLESAPRDCRVRELDPLRKGVRESDRAGGGAVAGVGYFDQVAISGESVARPIHLGERSRGCGRPQPSVRGPRRMRQAPRGKPGRGRQETRRWRSASGCGDASKRGHDCGLLVLGGAGSSAGRGDHLPPPRFLAPRLPLCFLCCFLGFLTHLPFFSTLPFEQGGLGGDSGARGWFVAGLGAAGDPGPGGWQASPLQAAASAKLNPPSTRASYTSLTESPSLGLSASAVTK